MTQPSCLSLINKGMYYAHSAVSQLGVSLTDVHLSYGRFAQSVESSHPGYVGFTLKTTNLGNLDDVMPLLVCTHERNHYVQLMSTPCGLLLWRLLNAISSTIYFLLEKIGGSNARQSCYIPLTQWYSSVGHEALRKDPPGPPKTEWTGLGMDPSVSPSTYKKHISDYVEYVFLRLVRQLQFLKTLEGRMPVTMGQFVELANEVFASLFRYCDLKGRVEWVARNMAASSYLPKNGFTLTEIIEAAARLQELYMLRGWHAHDRLLQEWKERSIFGVYKPAFEWLMSELGDPMLARVAIDISLTTPVDIACHEATGERIYVEDVLPSWRLPRVVHAMKETFWSTDRQEQDLNARQFLAERAGIPTPEKTLDTIIDKPFYGPLAFAGEEIQGIPQQIRLTEYITYVATEIRRAFQIRMHDSLEFIRPNQGPEVFQPLIEFYRDRALVTPSPLSEASESLYYKAYMILVGNLAALALVTDGDVSVLPHLQSSFLNYLSQFGDLKTAREACNVYTLLEGALDPFIYRLLRWG